MAPRGTGPSGISLVAPITRGRAWCSPRSSPHIRTYTVCLPLYHPSPSPPHCPPSLPQAMAYSAFLPSALWREVYLSVTAPSLAECTPMQLVQGLRALASLGVQPGWEWMGLWFEASAPLLHTCSTNLCSQVGGVLLSRSLLSVACPHISHPRDNFLLSWHPHVDRSTPSPRLPGLWPPSASCPPPPGWGRWSEPPRPT